MPDWEARWIAWLAGARARPHDWATWSCAHFAADNVLTLTGADPLGVLRGRWSDEDSANALLKTLGGLAQATNDALEAVGFKACPRVYAQRGDLVLFVAPHRVTKEPVELLAVVNGSRALVPSQLGAGGLVELKMSKAYRAWGIR